MLLVSLSHSVVVVSRMAYSQVKSIHIFVSFFQYAFLYESERHNNMMKSTTTNRENFCSILLHFQVSSVVTYYNMQNGNAEKRMNLS